MNETLFKDAKSTCSSHPQQVESIQNEDQDPRTSHQAIFSFENLENTEKSKDLKILLDMDAIDGKFELSNENDIDSTPVFRLRNQNPKLEIKIATEKPMQTEATTNKAKIISIPNSEKLLSKIVAQLGNSPAQLTGDSLLASDF